MAEKEIKELGGNGGGVIDMETGEITEEKQEEKVINAMPVRLKLLNAQKSKSGKVGIFGILYDSVDKDTGFLNVNNYIGKDKTAIISKWFENDKQAEALIDKKVLTDFVAVVSGNGNFMKMHKILSNEEAEALFALLS